VSGNLKSPFAFSLLPYYNDNF